jgi:hypothetical protein
MTVLLSRGNLKKNLKELWKNNMKNTLGVLRAKFTENILAFNACTICCNQLKLYRILLKPLVKI